MGVKYLWSIVEPACKEKPVGELFGKRVAIDTSCWVVSDNQILPSHIAKPHLRNLFFRTASLLENGIDPVYVLEGKAPELKAQVMKKRREARYGTTQVAPGTSAGASTSTTQRLPEPDSTGRSRYQYVQRECTELLNALGVVTITSMGEAEAACAGLNHQGAVDGCITVDGDAFLYGAKTVYRNLSTDLSNFVCQEYSMDLIESRLNLSRDKLVAMAILFGCDYLPDGVPGVGKDSALRVLSTWKNGKALEILKSWHSEKIIDESVPPRPAHCSQCKHPGSLRSHAKTGCFFCGKTSGGCKQTNEACHCEWHNNEIRYEEFAIRAKVFSFKELELEKIFEEFNNEIHTQRKGGAIPSWKMPCIKTFVQIATKKLKWEPQYAAEKILPLLGRWIMIHGRSVQHENNLPITPLQVLKKRIKRGCPMYELEWKFSNEMEHFPVVFQTLEPQFLIEREYPHLVPTPVPKPLKTARGKNNNKKIKPAKNKELDVIAMFKKMTIEKEVVSHSSPPPSESILLDMSGGTDDSDLSIIVHNICSRRKRIRNKNTPDSGNGVTSENDENSISILSSLKSKPNPQAPSCETEMKHSSACPLPNFSFNFSLEKLLETSSFSDHGQPQHDEYSEDICSTPLKSSDSQDKTEQDSFSTPSPLVERFSRLKRF